VKPLNEYGASRENWDFLYKGEGTPVISLSSDKGWSGISLAMDVSWI